jgi:hypothetical protein
MKHLPYAPYLMYMIERVTNVRYPKDVVHEPLRHLRDRAKRPPKAVSMLDRRVQLLPMMICPLHVPLLHLLVGTVAL